MQSTQLTASSTTAGAENPSRRLAASMFTDMVGYTAMAQRDESRALELLREHGQLLRPLFTKYCGRVIKSIGDGFLVEFPSALDAAQCAVSIQRTLQERNYALPPEQHFSIRIGLHV